MALDLTALLALASAALEDSAEGDDAANGFYAAIEAHSAETFGETSAYSQWGLKATQTELILRALELLCAEDESRRLQVNEWRDAARAAHPYETAFLYYLLKGN